jgi:hypothetical protein
MARRRKKAPARAVPRVPVAPAPVAAPAPTPTPPSPPRRKDGRSTTRPDNVPEPGDVSVEEFRRSIVNLLIKQQSAYTNPLGSEIEAVPTELGTQDLLDAEHVDAIIRLLISERHDTPIPDKEYRFKVGIFPVYSPDYLYSQAQTLVYKNIVSDPRNADKLPSAVPLPELAGLVGAQREAQSEANKKEEKIRNDKEKALRAEANSILVNKGILRENIFPHFLESVSGSPALLGNPKATEMLFDKAHQHIIPFRIGNHYTVAVVDCYTDQTDQKIAAIKYYNSLDGDLDPLLREQLKSFFASKGWNASYECVSRRDQNDGVNCGFFAAFKAIDLVNENYELQERLLRPEDGSQMIMARGLFIKWMQIMGLNVTPSAELKATLATLSAQQKQIEEAKQGIISWILHFEMAINGTTDKLLDPIMSKESFDHLWRRCQEQHRIAQEKLTDLKAKIEKSPEETKQIEELNKLLMGFSPLVNDYRQVAQLANANYTYHRQTPGFFAWFWQGLKNFPWLKTLFWLGAIAATAYFGWPYILQAATWAGTALPIDPIATIFTGAFVFVTGFAFVNNFMAYQVGAVDSEPAPAPPVPVENGPDVANAALNVGAKPAITPALNANQSPAPAAAPVPVVAPAPAPTARPQ